MRKKNSNIDKINYSNDSFVIQKQKNFIKITDNHADFEYKIKKKKEKKEHFISFCILII